MFNLFNRELKLEVSVEIPVKSSNNNLILIKKERAKEIVSELLGKIQISVKGSDGVEKMLRNEHKTLANAIVETLFADKCSACGGKHAEQALNDSGNYCKGLGIGILKDTKDAPKPEENAIGSISVNKLDFFSATEAVSKEHTPFWGKKFMAIDKQFSILFPLSISSFLAELVRALFGENPLQIRTLTANEYDEIADKTATDFLKNMPTPPMKELIPLIEDSSYFYASKIKEILFANVPGEPSEIKKEEVTSDHWKERI